MKRKGQAYSFTVPIDNEYNGEFKLPSHMLQKIQSRNKLHDNNIKTLIHSNDSTQKMMNELIHRLSIKHKYLSPTVLIDIIAIEIRSYLSEELHICLNQPLRHLIHSSIHPFGIILFPPRKSNISCPLVFNDKIQFQQLTSFQLDNYASRFSHAVFIGTCMHTTFLLQFFFSEIAFSFLF